jgi:hypothetical protein
MMITFEDRIFGRYPPLTKGEQRDMRRYYNAMNALMKGPKRRTRRLKAFVRKIALKG